MAKQKKTEAQPRKPCKLARSIKPVQVIHLMALSFRAETVLVMSEHEARCELITQAKEQVFVRPQRLYKLSERALHGRCIACSDVADENRVRSPITDVRELSVVATLFCYACYAELTKGVILGKPVTLYGGGNPFGERRAWTDRDFNEATPGQENAIRELEEPG